MRPDWIVAFVVSGILAGCPAKEVPCIVGPGEGANESDVEVCFMDDDCKMTVAETEDCEEAGYDMVGSDCETLELGAEDFIKSHDCPEAEEE